MGQKEVSMKARELLTLRYLPSLLESDESVRRLTDEEHVGGRVLNLSLLIVVCAFGYGLVMGSYHSLLQALAAGVKVVLLFAVALVICFPAFFVIQHILGSKLRF